MSTTSNSLNNQASSSSSTSGIQEYSVRLPKNQKKKLNVMRFNHLTAAEFLSWNKVKMVKENSKSEKNPTEDMPKYGAGSEYRREEKEEAKRKKYGHGSRQRNPDDQPWLLKYGGKDGKKYRGVKEGGVSENASYFVFVHGSNNVIEAYPVSDWYNFVGIQRFKPLTAEEAEEEFGRRNKSIAILSNKMFKRLKADEEDGDQGKGGSSKSRKDLKISEMDEWVDSDEDFSEKEEGDDEDNDDEPKKKKKQGKKPKKKATTNDDESAVEESDDGDEEGRELDYISSDSFESETDEETKVNKELKGVEEEDGLRNLLTSDEEEEEEQEKGEEGKSKEETSTVKSEPEEKSKRQDQSVEKTLKRKASDSSSDVGSSESETEKNAGNGSSSETQSSSKQATKRLCTDNSTGSDTGITEEAVRRYLTRKPMTATELLAKFRRLRTNLNTQAVFDALISVLKKINPHRQMIKDKMYLSLQVETT